MNDEQPQLPPSASSAARTGQSRFLWWWRWFWRVALVVSIPTAWYCFYVPSNDIAWADNYAAAQQRAVQSDKPILLFFTGKWCVPCRVMKRDVWADEQVAEAVNAAFVPVTIDIDDRNEAAVISSYHVAATPSTIFTDRQGKILRRVDGAMNKAEFVELLGKLQALTDKDR